MSHDVFLSYSSADRPAARRVLAALQGERLTVFLDERELAAGQNFVTRLEGALLACKSVAILLGPNGLGKWRSLRRDRSRRVRAGVVLTFVAAIAMLVGFAGLLVFVATYASFTGDEKALERYQREVYERKVAPLAEPPNAARHINRLGMDMIWCGPGTFEMGSPGEEPARFGDEQFHSVTLSNGFYLARNEVTQGQWKQIMEKNPSLFHWDDRLPVEGVSWNGAMTFCRALTKLEQETGTLPEGWTYTLPTEAQWEYACRAGSSAPFSGPTLRDIGWYIGNSWFHTHPVEQKTANRWGFYDMHGNVNEWCQDGYWDCPRSSVTDPQGAAHPSNRVFRGGSWYNNARRCRSAFRIDGPPGYRVSILGFRVK